MPTMNDFYCIEIKQFSIFGTMVALERARSTNFGLNVFWHCVLLDCFLGIVSQVSGFGVLVLLKRIDY